MKTSPHIFKTAPHLVQKVWGGGRLAKQFGKAPEFDGPLGEAWEVADLDEGQSLVASGPLAGLPLRALVGGWGRSLVGRRAPTDDRFPLLVKLLDARRDLSVQVHPSPTDAEAIEGADSKEETWLVLDADEGAEILHGLVDNVSAEDFRQAVDDGDVEELLHRQPVNAGDVIHIRPGTIHAICEGVVLLEIQEPSDTTYRVYDYGRPGLDGTPRQLHIDEALRVARLAPSVQVLSPTAENDGVELLGETRAYRVERVDFEAPGGVRWSVDPDSPQVLSLVSGRLNIDDGIGGTLELKAGQTAVVPAISGSVRMEVCEASQLVVSGLAVDSLLRGLYRGPKVAVGAR